MKHKKDRPGRDGLKGGQWLSWEECYFNHERPCCFIFGICAANLEGAFEVLSEGHL